MKADTVSLEKPSGNLEEPGPKKSLQSGGTWSQEEFRDWRILEPRRAWTLEKPGAHKNLEPRRTWRLVEPTAKRSLEPSRT